MFIKKDEDMNEFKVKRGEKKEIMLPVSGCGFLSYNKDIQVVNQSNLLKIEKVTAKSHHFRQVPVIITGVNEGIVRIKEKTDDTNGEVG